MIGVETLVSNTRARVPRLLKLYQTKKNYFVNEMSNCANGSAKIVQLHFCDLMRTYKIRMVISICKWILLVFVLSNGIEIELFTLSSVG